ncbi:hypothetical protein E2C01_068459 [Portunus trituberculatus]|uniref:Uncharacterized protein n=1 Tax=Portunus trituberculatus TaxID=210409 RepID=A0A5B7HMG4_PORTR|nr:hypothetical protein [Portunus trituberculatus]
MNMETVAAVVVVILVAEAEKQKHYIVILLLLNLSLSLQKKKRKKKEKTNKLKHPGTEKLHHHHHHRHHLLPLLLLPHLPPLSSTLATSSCSSPNVPLFLSLPECKKKVRCARFSVPVSTPGQDVTACPGAASLIEISILRVPQEEGEDRCV